MAIEEFIPAPLLAAVEDAIHKVQIEGEEPVFVVSGAVHAAAPHVLGTRTVDIATLVYFDPDTGTVQPVADIVEELKSAVTKYKLLADAVHEMHSLMCGKPVDTSAWECSCGVITTGDQCGFCGAKIVVHGRKS